ncbi:hypothetical protein GB931_04020 [Modestobacter sp. I12A-02628]|uniref:Transmembrane protein n=1 Tax=Goekera deserti TaxID=2497753 RepID=A0A7K3WLD6_9ACTN|nr:hypothetical protein [Goekera deserti]MPQ97105.1 hypothetical protein [Goekera deserti]NDI46577.1 hypothetical protein [Goekera deserti]NEL56333.1 hypothetical protein [Goekera deserti]
MTKNLGLGHAVRRLTVGAGEMKRRSDRAEMWLRVLLALAFSLVVPIGSSVAGAAATQLGAVAEAQHAELTRVDAVLTEDASTYADTSSGAQVAVAATWPGGSGEVRADLDARRGDVVPVWLDTDGQRQVAPLDAAQVRTQAVSVGVVVGGFAALGAVLLYALAVAALNARRVAQWEAGWARVEPVWAQQLR